MLLGLWQLHARLNDRLDPELEGRPVSIRGTVASVPQGTLQALKFRVATQREGDTESVPRLIELTWYDAPTPRSRSSSLRNSAIALSMRVSSSLSSLIRRPRASSAAERARAQFTWHAAQKKLVKVYEKLLA